MFTILGLKFERNYSFVWIKNSQGSFISTFEKWVQNKSVAYTYVFAEYVFSNDNILKIVYLGTDEQSCAMNFVN